jgi:hypothetical protein
VIERLEAVRVPRHDRFLHRVSLQPLGPKRLWFPLRVHWALHRRSVDGAGWLSAAARFPAFLQRQWHLDDPWQVPLYMLRKGAPRLLRRPRTVWSRADPVAVTRLSGAGSPACRRDVPDASPGRGRSRRR